VDRLLIILLIPGLLCALYLAAQRHRVESHNRAVELTLDYSEIQDLSSSTNVPMTQLLQRFKEAGVTGVAVGEETVADLITTDRAKLLQTRTKSVLSISNATDSRQILDRILSRFPSMNLIDTSNEPGKPINLIFAGSPQVLSQVGLGLPLDAVQTVQAAGLDVVARLQNDPIMTTQAIDASIDELAKQNVHRVIFQGDEVLGFHGLVKHTADKLKSAGILYGSIEFGKQKGDTIMSEKLKSDFVRVHSISSAEMATMSPAEMVERFSRAAKERNIRLCYVRLPDLVGETPVESALAFVSEIRGQIAKSGYSVGEAHTFTNVRRPLPLRVLMALSIVAGLLLLLDSLFSMPSGLKYSLLAIGLVLGGGLCMFEKGMQVLALMSALVFPTLGVTALVGPLFGGEVENKSPIKKTLALFIECSVISLCGALLIVGLLADKVYMVKVDQFLGIKAAHGLPILAIALFMACGLPMLGKPLSEVRKSITEHIRKIVNHPLFVWHVLAVVFALAIIGFALMRTGNDSGLGVSGFELKFRAILDKVMLVRPRTKEFLIGHPAFFLGIAFLLTRRRALGLPLVALGMLGQVSVVNTFCHIHTPLAMSAVRTVNGLVAGLLVSWVLWLLFGKVGARQG
jgi:hypothetical protein